MQRDELKSIIENILLAADQPVHVGELEKIFLNTAEKKDLQLILEELKEEYRSRNLQILEVADGYQLCTRHEFNDWIRKFLKLANHSNLSNQNIQEIFGLYDT